MPSHVKRHLTRPEARQILTADSLSSVNLANLEDIREAMYIAWQKGEITQRQFLKADWTIMKLMSEVGYEKYL